ncbi:hypothetical protein JW859_12325 [bacterium]|nr:hypothetical protein [bacterium]
MVRPIEGILSLSQVQTALEMLQTAQREAAIAQLRQERDTEKAKDIYQTTVTEREEARGRTIRDDDPRQGRPRRERDDLPRPENDDDAPHVDIVV